MSMYDNEESHIYDPEPALEMVGEYMDLQREVHAAVRKVLVESKYFYLKDREKALEGIFDQVEYYCWPKAEIKLLSKNGYDVETNYGDL